MAQIDRFSYSQLSMWQRCGEQYRRRYIEKERIPPGVALIRGKAVDAAVTRAYRQKRDEGKTRLDELLDIAAQAVEDSFHDEVWLDEKEKTKGFKQVKGEVLDVSVDLVSCHYQEVLPRVQPKLVQPKTEIEVPDLGVKLIGYLDVVEQDGTIRDTKTTKKSPSADAAEKSDQLAWYAMGWKAATGKQSPWQVLDFLVALKRGSVAKERRTCVPPGDQARLMRRIRAAVQGINAGIFPPANPDTWWCSPRWCGYYESCPYVRNRMMVDLGSVAGKIKED